MSSFRQCLHDIEHEELHLHGRLYTWSNEQAHPLLEKLNHAFVSLQWCDLFLHHGLRALSSACSDHAPLLLHTNIDAPLKKRFRFEAI
jgi:hypothetical protein